MQVILGEWLVAKSIVKVSVILLGGSLCGVSLCVHRILLLVLVHQPCQIHSFCLNSTSH